MSSYINFYIKSNGNEFIPIGSYSRNSAIYEYGNHYVPYEKGGALTKRRINEILNDIRIELGKYDDTIKKYNDQKALIATMNNSVEDKCNAIHEVDCYIDEVNKITKNLINAKYFYIDLYRMVDAASDEYDEEDFLLAGVEWNPNYKEE